MLVLLTNQRHHYRDRRLFSCMCPAWRECDMSRVSRGCSWPCLSCDRISAIIGWSPRWYCHTIGQLPCTRAGAGRGRGRGTPHFMLNTFNFPPNCPLPLPPPPQLLDLVCSPGCWGSRLAELCWRWNEGQWLGPKTFKERLLKVC